MHTVALSIMNSTTAIPPVVPGDDSPKDPPNPRNDSSAITVAAPAASLILVLVAIVVWFFLVRLQLRKNAKKGRRRLYNSSLREGQNGSKGSRLSTHSSPYGTPRSHRKSGGSPKEKHRSCTCAHHEEEMREVCTCGVPHNPPKPHKHSKPTANGISTVCSGNSPFCPHSTKMKHHADIHSGASSLSFELNELSPLSEQNTMVTLEPRGRANTGDYTTLTKPTKKKKNCDDMSMVLRRSAMGYPWPNCACHPLNGFERKPCSCALKHPLSHTKRGAREAGLYFSAPSLVQKQMHSPC
ncbi:uncharacterized protein [Apostichopus japonicus]